MNIDDGLALIDLVGEIVFDPHSREDLQEWVDQTKHELGQLIENQTSPSGIPYAPLARSTVARKGHSTALFETGKMIQSLVSSGEGHIEEVTDTTAVLGTGHQKDGKPIAAWMQEGTKKSPARPFVGVNDNMADHAAETIADGILRQIESLGT